MIKIEVREWALTLCNVKEFDTVSEAHVYMLKRAEFWRTTKLWDANNSSVELSVRERPVIDEFPDLIYCSDVIEKLIVCRYANIWERERRFNNGQV